MFDLALGICNLFCDSFLSTFQFSVSVKIFFGIFPGGKGGVKGDGDLLIGIIVKSLK